MATTKIIHSFWIYVVAAVVLLAAILATIITLGHIDTEDVTP